MQSLFLVLHCITLCVCFTTASHNKVMSPPTPQEQCTPCVANILSQLLNLVHTIRFFFFFFHWTQQAEKKKINLTYHCTTTSDVSTVICPAVLLGFDRGTHRSVLAAIGWKRWLDASQLLDFKHAHSSDKLQSDRQLYTWAESPLMISLCTWY